MTPKAQALVELVTRLSKAQREAIVMCADVEDRFPCKTCHLCKSCIFTRADRAAAADACNSASGVVNGSGFEALRNHIVNAATPALALCAAALRALSLIEATH